MHPVTLLKKYPYAAVCDATEVESFTAARTINVNNS